jgi:hypothetical protein
MDSADKSFGACKECEDLAGGLGSLHELHPYLVKCQEPDDDHMEPIYRCLICGTELSFCPSEMQWRREVHPGPGLR